MSPPPDGTPEYRWWLQGAKDEADAQDEGLTFRQREVRDLFTALARRWPEEYPDVTLMRVLRIYTANLPLKWRLKHAWELIRR